MFLQLLHVRMLFCNKSRVAGLLPSLQFVTVPLRHNCSASVSRFPNRTSSCALGHPSRGKHPQIRGPLTEPKLR